MSAAGTTDGTKAEPYPFSVATSEKFEKFARPYIFPAGEWIAAPGRVVVGWHRIVSGIVATSDENMADLARRGIVLEPGDMFGEYALVPNGRPFPSGLRALTEVTTRCLPAEVYPGLAAEIKGLDLLVRRREKLNRFLPAFMAALKRHRSLENVPPYQLMKLAQLGEVIELSDGAALGLQVDTFDLVFVASGELEIANLARLPAGSLFRYVQDPSGQWPTVAREKETVLLRVDRRRVAQVAPRYIHLSSALRHESERTTRRPDAHGAVESSTANLARPGNGRTRASKRAARAQVVEPASVAKPVGATTLRVNTALVWSDRELPPLAALTALLAHALQLEQPRDGDFKVGLLILQPSGTGSPKAKRGAKNNGFELPAQVSANDDGVRVLRWSVREGCEGQDLSTGLAELKVDTDLILIDPSHCRTDQMAAALGTVVSKMLYFVGDSFAPVPSAFRHREISITRCVLLREATWGTFTAYYPGTVRLHFDNFAGLGDRKLSRLSDRDRNSVSRCGRALMERRVGIALGGGSTS